MKLDIPCLALLASLAGAGAFAPSTIVSPVIIGHRSALQPRHAAFGVPHGPQVQTSFRSSSCGAGVSALKSSNGSMKVWVQVITGPDDDDGNYDMSLSETSVDVKVGTDIANLCKAVKKKLPEDFDGISLVRLQVYKSIDSNSKPEGTALGPRDEIPTNADPLYVVAPPRPVQVQPAGESSRTRIVHICGWNSRGGRSRSDCCRPLCSVHFSLTSIVGSLSPPLGYSSIVLSLPPRLGHHIHSLPSSQLNPHPWSSCLVSRICFVVPYMHVTGQPSCLLYVVFVFVSLLGNG